MGRILSSVCGVLGKEQFKTMPEQSRSRVAMHLYLEIFGNHLVNTQEMEFRPDGARYTERNLRTGGVSASR